MARFGRGFPIQPAPAPRPSLGGDPLLGYTNFQPNAFQPNAFQDAAAITSFLSGAVGVALETDTALGLTKLKIKALGVATETETALAPSLPKRIYALGMATETDTALALSLLRVRATGVSAETDAAQALTHSRARGAGQASETDTALALSISKAKAVGISTETDTAIPLTTGHAIATGRANETDAAVALTTEKVRATGTLTEADASLALGRIKLASSGRANEIDTAFTLTGGPPPEFEFDIEVTEPVDVAAFDATLVASAEFTVTELPDTTANFEIDQPNDIHFGAINIWVQGSEAPDVAAFEMESEGAISPPSQAGNGRPRDFRPIRKPEPVEMVMRATEAPDVCRMLIEIDWTDDDAAVLLLAMEAA